MATTLLGRFLAYVAPTTANAEDTGSDEGKRGKRSDPPTPSEFHMRWMSTDELCAVTDKAERNAISLAREENWRAQLGGHKFGRTFTLRRN